MKPLLRAGLALALGANLCACATITRGTTEKFVVQTDPSGASVETTSGFSCPSTPCTFKMQRKEKFDVTIRKAGYQTATAHVASKLSGGGGAGFLGNAVIGGVIGAGVDATSGAMRDLTPNPLKVKLVHDTAAAAPTKVATAGQ